MSECNSIETLANTQLNLNAIRLSDETKFRLNEINKIKDYFNSEIQERRKMRKKMSNYIAGFDYADKTLIVLSNKLRNEYYLFYNCYWSSWE